MELKINNTTILITKDISALWPRFNKENSDNVINITDIDIESVKLIIKYLHIFKDNYFGIHAPLKNRSNNDEIYTSLIESGVPKILLDYCNNIHNKLFMKLYTVSYTENIPMLTELLGAFIAYISSIYKWNRIHFYYLKYKKINKFEKNKTEDNLKKIYINSELIEKYIGYREFIYDKNYIPLNLNNELNKITNATFISSTEICTNYKLMKEIDEDIMENKKIYNIKYSERFKNLEKIPDIDKINNSQKEKIENMLKSYIDYSDDDESYIDEMDTCERLTEENHNQFIKDKEQRSNIRTYLKELKIKNKNDLLEYSYDFIKNYDYSYINDNNFKILIDLIDTNERNELKHNLKINYLKFIPQDIDDKSEDGYFITLEEQGFKPEDIFT